MQVYISHSEKDRDLVLQLSSKLEQAGFVVWNPYENILPGDNWAQETANALASSEIMVVLLTRNAGDRLNLERDVQFALTSGNYRGRVVPVVIGQSSFKTRQNVPWVLLRLNPIILAQRPFKFEEVVERVQSLAHAGSYAAH